MTKKKHGFTSKRKQAGERVKDPDSLAYLSVPVPKAKHKPKAFAASNFDKALQGMKVSYSYAAKKTKGGTVKQSLAINSLDDFRTDSIAKQSKELSHQQWEKEILHKFLNQLDPENKLRMVFDLLLKAENKKEIVEFLKKFSDNVKSQKIEGLQLITPGHDN